MNALQVWKRLLWKEFREGRLVVIMAALAPLVMFRAALAYRTDSIERTLMVVPAAVGVHLAIAFWGAGRGGSKRTGSEFSWTHLPTSPAIEWLASMIVPALVIASLGLWYGWLAAPAGAGIANAISMPIAGMIDLATTFALCYLISMVISNWAAYIFGVFRMVGGTLISVWNLTPMLGSDVVGFATRTLIGSMLGAFVYVVLFRKKSVAFRQGMSLIAVVAAIFAPVVVDVVPRALGPSGIKLDWLLGDYVTDNIGKSFGNSDDRSLDIRLAGISGKENYIDYALRRGDNEEVITTHRFKYGTGVLSVLPDGRVYLVRPTRSTTGVEIIEWNAHTGAVRKVLTMPVRGRIFNESLDLQDRTYQKMVSTSPDGRYMVLWLRPLLSSAGIDLWLLDLERGTYSLVMPNSLHNDPSLVWSKDALALFDSNTRLLRVNLKTFDAKWTQLQGAEVDGL